MSGSIGGCFGNLEFHPLVLIIMITAYGYDETKRRALEGGVEALLTKPIDFVALRSEIDMRVEHAA